MSISITKFADKKIGEMLADSDQILRVRVRGGGCSGLSYEFCLESKPEDDDITFEFDHSKICIDKKSYIFLHNIEIDYEEDIFKSGILIRNPNAQRSCGCGESFSVG